jgi:uncharacterized membrane protein
MPSDLLQEAFLGPFRSGYSPLATLFYGLLLGGGILALSRLLRILEVEVGRRFLLSASPFLLLGPILQVLVEAGLLPFSPFLVSPLLFFTLSLLFLTAFWMGRSLESKKGIPYEWTVFAVGSLPLPPLFSLLLPEVQDLHPLLQVFWAWLAFTLPVLIFLRLTPALDDPPWTAPLYASHLLDVATTYVAIGGYGFREEFALEAALIRVSGTALVLLPLKLVVLTVVLITLRRTVEERSLRFWYFALLVLGLAPGLRNALALLLA